MTARRTLTIDGDTDFDRAFTIWHQQLSPADRAQILQTVAADSNRPIAQRYHSCLLWIADHLERFTPAALPADGRNYAGRTLTRFTCSCGFHGEMFLRPADPRQCLDCRQAADRERNGWNPGNSVD